MKKSSDMQMLRKGELEVVIVNGYPSSLTFDSSGTVYPVFHTGGLPSDHDLREPEVDDFPKWPNRSGKTMFPVVGPVKENTIIVNGMHYSQPKHGFSDDIGHSFTRKERENILVYTQNYKGGKVKTKDGNFSFVPYKLVRKFSIDDYYSANSLSQETLIINNSNEPMRYMYGEHFSFKSPKNPKNGRFVFKDQSQFDLLKVIEDSKKWATVRKKTEDVTYIDLERGIGVNFWSNLGGLMFWSPGPFFAIEPITNAPIRPEKQKYFEPGSPCQRLDSKGYVSRYTRIMPFLF